MRLRCVGWKGVVQKNKAHGPSKEYVNKAELHY